MFAQYSEYILHLLILICLYIMLAQSFNLTFGLGRLFNLAHIANYAIGAYTTALLAVQYEMGFFTCITMSFIFSSFFSLLIGAIAIRLTKDYFAIGSMAFSALVLAVIINWKDLTRGVLGIPGIPRPVIFAYEFENNLSFFYLIFSLTIITSAILYFIFKSPLGRSLRAQAELEFASLSLAKNVKLVRNLAFIISAGFAGLAGSMFAYYINYIDPSSFSFNESVLVLSIVIIGSPGSFWGVLAGAAFLTLLPEPLRFIEISPGILGPMRQMLQALILFAVVYVQRERLFPVQRRI